MTRTRSPRFYRYTVTFAERDLGAVLDMMRYEQATVLDWHSPAALDPTRPDRKFWRVDLRCDAVAFQPDRWASFLMTPSNVRQSDF